MANIAYSHLYIEISGEVLSGESNEMHARSISPCAIYGSAGAATLRYPFEDMIRYFSNRSIHESFNSVWTELDKMWKHYVDTKDADARASGRAEYVPSPDERADHYIVDFERSADNRGITQSKLSFLMPMTEVNGNSAVEALFESIAAAAQKELTDDLRFEKERENLGLSDPETAQRELNALIDSMTIADDKAGMFSLISDIDKNLEEPISTADIAAYCQYSTEHFCRLFKKCFNQTFKEYLNAFRVQKAKAFIDLGNSATLAAVSSKFGFTNQNHFSRMFKKHIGVLPSEYMNQKKEIK